MYLYARLFGIATYLAALTFTLVILRKVKKEQSQYILFFYLVLLFIIAYCYEPAPQADLYRIRQYAKNFTKYTWSEFFSRIAERTAGFAYTPAAAIWYRLLGLTGNNGLIASSSCLICFGIIFYVMNKVRLYYDLSGACIAMTLFWFMSADYYMPTIATIRSYIASALVFLCIYREARNYKTGVAEILLYALASLMHSIGIALVALRIGGIVFRKNQRANIKILYMAAIALGGIIAYRYYADVILNSWKTFQGYLFRTGSSGKYSYVWERIILTLMLALQIHTLHRAKENHVEEDFFLNTFYSVGCVCVAVLIPAMVQFTFFMRLSYFTSLVELPLVMYNNSEVSEGRGLWTVNMIAGGSITMLLLTCARGYLCSLKFWGGGYKKPLPASSLVCEKGCVNFDL